VGCSATVFDLDGGQDRLEAAEASFDPPILFRDNETMSPITPFDIQTAVPVEE